MDEKMDAEIGRQNRELAESDEDLLSEGTTALPVARGDISSDNDIETQRAFDSAHSEDKNTTSGQSFTAPPFQFVPLKMGGNGGRTHIVSNGSRRLLSEEVSTKDLQTMTELFYDKAFQDATLDRFIRSHDDPHGDRFARWIHQKLSGSTAWDDDRRRRDLEPVTLAGGRRYVVHDRSSAHAAAWYSPKRPPEDVGRHFELDECRVWMRLHFWAMRESGVIAKSPSFADYYVRFIAHFVRVYENTAPAFARESFRWSGDIENIQTYIDNGRAMKDVLGLSLSASSKLRGPGLRMALQSDTMKC